MRAKLISIIGPPAVGKTTLAEFLAAELPAEIRREDYEGNAFLADSYMGRAEARLPAQLCYLLSRVRQLSRWNWPSGGVVVTDYGFCQDRIYAQAQLTDDELELYDHLAARVGGLVRRPDVIVHLDATPETLLKRIARRGRAFEKTMTADFLQSMRHAYNSLSAPVSGAVIRVDCDSVDLQAAAVRQEMIAEIRRAL